jgi:quercetin dioxygenase-like cupin family protein
MTEDASMNRRSLVGAASVLLAHAVAATPAAAQAPSTPSATPQSITRAGEQPSAVGSADFFTGRVRVDPVWPADGHINASGAWVTFEPGARSAWHTHPAGQRLVVVSGVGLTQEWGKPVRRSGPATWSAPAGSTLARRDADHRDDAHLAVTGTADGKNVTWMEKVSDEQYQGK